MKVTDDMGRLIPAKVQEAVEKLAKPVKIELPDFPGQIAALEEKVAELDEKLEKLAKQPADVNGDGKVDEKDLSVVHKAYSKAKKGAKAKKVVSEDYFEEAFKGKLKEDK